MLICSQSERVLKENMDGLWIRCERCNAMSKFNWCFGNEVVLSSSTCKKCSDTYHLNPPKQKTEDIITDRDFLPYPHQCDAFFCNQQGNFVYYQLSKDEISLPILLLKKYVNYNFKDGRQFKKNVEGLVQLKDIENYINNLSNI